MPGKSTAWLKNTARMPILFGKENDKNADPLCFCSFLQNIIEKEAKTLKGTNEYNRTLYCSPVFHFFLFSIFPLLFFLPRVILFQRKRNGVLAQLVARDIRIVEARGSTPLYSTKKKNQPEMAGFLHMENG